jgi:hypothetical protein
MPLKPCFTLGACVLLGLLAGCAKKSSPTDATLEAGTYTNHFFAFTVRVPKGWTVMNKESFDRAKEVGAKIIAGGDKQSEAVMKASEHRSKQLLLISEKPLGAPVDVNRSLILAAEDLSGAPGIQTGKDYFFHALKLMTGPGKPLKQLNEPFKVALGAKEFYRVDLSASIMGRDFQQAYFAAVEKNNALILVATAESGEKIGEILTNAGFSQTKQ